MDAMTPEDVTAMFLSAESPPKIWEQTDPCIYRFYEIIGVYAP